jgi:hypothetical protein
MEQKRASSASELCRLTASAESILREQAIDPDGPGSILRDVHALLDFVGPLGIPTNGRRCLLPRASVGELNARMSRPLGVRLKRPQQRSYPNVDGLYLLGRSSGLIQVRETGAKSSLIVDEEVRRSWDGLNATEQYFTLLEAWLVHARSGMLGMGRGDRDIAIFGCVTLWRSIGSSGLVLDRNWRYMPGIGSEFLHLALMDMFGLLAVEDGPSKEGEGWRPSAVRKTAWGDAVFALLQVPKVMVGISAEANPGQVVFGRLQRVFRPFIPTWRRNLSLPAPVFREGVFVFRVSLGTVWRLIAIPAGMTLEDLAAAILKAFRFDMDHLYQFTYTDRFGASVGAMHPYCEEQPSAEDVCVGDLPLAVGGTMEFLYDFGDDWRFQVKLARTEPARAGFKRPAVLESQGEAPSQYDSP